MIINPQPSFGKILNLRDRLKQMLCKLFVSHGSVITLNVGILLRIAWLDIVDPNTVLSALLIWDRHLTDREALWGLDSGVEILFTVAPLECFELGIVLDKANGRGAF